ncbi:GNAT family N-acetyltransferase [Streptomyces sp. NBRC 110028]|uniref:GNAT family N-acetyltransferase n=1 Tax=Streptomyces sp. NBRC 110028 TaxID=1621260 RepID=UPI000A9BBDC2|nr:GNAT family N-acetyltransferase [Streptomyces sp. NBRC 110028]
MPAATIRPRTGQDLAACLSALATVQRADRYPVDWPEDPEGWLTPDGMLGAWVATTAEGPAVQEPAVQEPAVLGHVMLTRADPALADAIGAPAEGLAAVARLFVTAAARRRGLAAGLLGHAARAAVADGLRPVLEVDSGATAAIGLYERAGWRFVRAMTADWHTADGHLAVVHAYSGPAGL